MNFSLFTGIEAATLREWVSCVAGGARADWDVIAGLAVCVHTARSLTGVDAVAVSAGEVTAAFGVVEALGALAVGDRVSGVALHARAHWTAADYGALGVLAAGTAGAARTVRHC